MSKSQELLKFANSTEFVKYIITLIITKGIEINGDCDCGQAGTLTKFDKNTPVKKLDDIIRDTAKRLDENREKVLSTYESKQQIIKQLQDLHTKKELDKAKQEQDKKPLNEDWHILSAEKERTYKQLYQAYQTPNIIDQLNSKLKQIDKEIAEIRQKLEDINLNGPYMKTINQISELRTEEYKINVLSCVGEIFQDMSGTIPSLNDYDYGDLCQLVVEYYQNNT